MVKKKQVRKMSKHDRELLAAADPEILHGIDEIMRVYSWMSEAALSAEPSVSGGIAITQALSKIIAHYKRAMGKIGIDVTRNLHDCVAIWETRLNDGKDEAEQAKYNKFADAVVQNQAARALLVNVGI